MGRTVVKRVDQPRGRHATDYLVIAGAAAILLFAVVGVVSAGAFVANKVSGNTATPTPRAIVSSSSRSAAVQDVARAQAQATAIVRTARQASSAIVAQATKRANRRAASIVAAAKHKSAAATAQPPTLVFVPTAIPAPQSLAGQATLPTVTVPQTTGQSLPAGSPATGTTNRRPDLSAVPASWLVVGYNATFGGGPGNAGSISVLNRSGKLFSGVARVTYTTGGSSSATFANLAPGENLVLPLNGSRYSGGGYHIVMVNVH